MKIGVLAGARREGYSLDETLQQIVEAERDGLDSYWLPHISSAGFDALTALSLGGRETSRIELGTAVVPTFPRHPLALAQQALTAQAATAGRLTLGIGLSHQPSIEDSMGLSYDRPARHMREYLSVLRPLLDQGSVGFSGQVYKVNAALSVPGASPVHVIIAALAPRMLALAGEVADGTVTWMAGLKAIDTHVTPKIRAAAEAAGRPPPRVCVALPVAVTDDVSAARERAARAFERYGQLTNYRRILDVEGAEGPSEVAVVGDEVSVERQVRAFADAGATDFIGSIMPVGDDPIRSAERTRSLLRELVGKV